MKGARALQIILGILSVILTIALGSITLLVILPMTFSADLTNVVSILRTAIEATVDIANSFGLTGIAYVLPCVVFALPTLLMLVATNLLLFGKKRSTGVGGCVLGTIALAIFDAFVCYFAKQLVGEKLVMLLYIIVGATTLFYLLFVVLYGTVSKKYCKKCYEYYLYDDVPIDYEYDVDTQTDTSNTDSVDVVVEEIAPVVVEDTDGDGQVLFMAQDYSSVSDISDETYNHTDVLSQKVLEKLKLARDLYEKGAITKDEYLNIVQKYLEESK